MKYLTALFCLITATVFGQNQYYGAFHGNGVGLTNVNASTLNNLPPSAFVQLPTDSSYGAFPTNASQFQSQWAALPVNNSVVTSFGGGTITLGNGIFIFTNQLAATNRYSTLYTINGNGIGNTVLLFTCSNQDCIYLTGKQSSGQPCNLVINNCTIASIWDTTNFLVHVDDGVAVDDHGGNEVKLNDVFLGYWPLLTNNNFGFEIGVAQPYSATNLCGIYIDTSAGNINWLTRVCLQSLHQGYACDTDHTRDQDVQYESDGFASAGFTNAWPTNSPFYIPCCIHMMENIGSLGDWDFVGDHFDHSFCSILDDGASYGGGGLIKFLDCRMESGTYLMLVNSNSAPTSPGNGAIGFYALNNEGNFPCEYYGQTYTSFTVYSQPVPPYIAAFVGLDYSNNYIITANSVMSSNVYLSPLILTYTFSGSTKLYTNTIPANFGIPSVAEAYLVCVTNDAATAYTTNSGYIDAVSVLDGAAAINTTSAFGYYIDRGTNVVLVLSQSPSVAANYSMIGANAAAGAPSSMYNFQLKIKLVP